MPYLKLTWFAAAVLCCACSDARRSPPAPAAAAPSSAAAMWGASYFPNIPLTTDRGQHVRFFDLIRDKVVAVNFIYTRCTDSCPMETARMVEVQRLLGDRLGKDVFFYSISIDPEHDTPERLRAYAETWHVGPGWTFLTGTEADVTLLRKRLGVYAPDRAKRNHDLGLVMGNQTSGRWMKRSALENPYVLANQLGSWLHNWKLASVENRDYAQAPPVRNISSGEELFRARCAACHVIGGIAGAPPDPALLRVGPDLLNITQHRDRGWLKRWLMHPDQMIAAGDPIATALLAQYAGIVMPNLRLKDGDVENVLQYIDEESRFVGRRGASIAPPAPAPHGAMTAHVLRETRDALTRYDQVRERLAADDLAGAREAAAALVSRTGALDVAARARGIAAAADLAAARADFAELSRSVVSLLVAEPALRAGWFVFRCPMAPGYQNWAQANDRHENPYWGKRMLHCATPLLTWSDIGRNGTA